uniref:Disease resistance protein At4g27190-like leucine-rich repeats domain-containing protein n=1 Tax=Setaria italica TaxID=4555 RepID=K3XR57_SETIT
FASPPFLCCHSLRLLWIDSCSDNEVANELVEKQESRWISLKGLWVLDIRRTDWAWILTPEMMELMVELGELNLKAVSAGRRSWCTTTSKFKWSHNLRKLRVVESPTFLELELLDLSGNSTMESLPNLSSASSRLKVLILDGCDGLETVEPGVLPASLESLSFNGFGPALRWKHLLQVPGTEDRPSARETRQKLPRVSKISLQGLTQLKDVFLRGLPDLEELNLSGTAVEALNLEAMQVQERIFLMGREKLRRVRWRNIKKPPLKLLCVDTSRKETRSLDDGCHGSQQDTTSLVPLVHIVVTDVRFLRGFMFGNPSDIVFNCFHLHLSSTVWHSQVKGVNKEKDISSGDEWSVPQAVRSSFPYLGVHNNMVGQGDAEDDGSLMQEIMALQTLQRYIEISEGGCSSEATNKNPDKRSMDYLLYEVQSLHVHDHSSITFCSIKRILEQFVNMRWCMIDWCPKLQTVFRKNFDHIHVKSFMSLETFKASHLREVQCIWSKGIRFIDDDADPFLAFGKLRNIHLHSCPSLKFVLPWSFATLPSLEIIHITYCATTIKFPRLKRIHLHDLPMLQQICETDMLALALETIKVRGCWSLRRLPAIHSGRGNDKAPALVDYEEDWWDKLQWDGLEESRNLFAPCYSRY